MRKNSESAHTADAQLAGDAPAASGGLPNRLLTAFEVAEFVGCHEETVRRAYLRGLLVSQRFGVRGRGFIPQTSSTGFVEEHQPECRNLRHHEGVCRFLSDGVDIRPIQLMLGHADIKQTQRCLNITDDQGHDIMGTV
jgi:hypothetical protein